MINKTDLAPAVGADLAVMERDALRMRDGGPFVFAQVCWVIGGFCLLQAQFLTWGSSTIMQLLLGFKTICFLKYRIFSCPKFFLRKD